MSAPVCISWSSIFWSTVISLSIIICPIMGDASDFILHTITSHFHLLITELFDSWFVCLYIRELRVLQRKTHNSLRKENISPPYQPSASSPNFPSPVGFLSLCRWINSVWTVRIHSQVRLPPEGAAIKSSRNARRCQIVLQDRGHPPRGCAPAAGPVAAADAVHAAVCRPKWRTTQGDVAAIKLLKPTTVNVCEEGGGGGKGSGGEEKTNKTAVQASSHGFDFAGECQNSLALPGRTTTALFTPVGHQQQSQRLTFKRHMAIPQWRHVADTRDATGPLVCSTRTDRFLSETGCCFPMLHRRDARAVWSLPCQQLHLSPPSLPKSLSTGASVARGPAGLSMRRVERQEA